MTQARLIPKTFQRWLPSAYGEWDIRTQRRGQLVLLLAWLYAGSGIGLTFNHLSEQRYVFAGLTAKLTCVMLAVLVCSSARGTSAWWGTLSLGAFSSS